MNSIVRRLAWVAVICVALTMQGLAEGKSELRVEGLINHYTADLDGNGPWHVMGPWSLQTKKNGPAAASADFAVALSMVRADGAPRQPHTHHVHLAGGEVTPIPGGLRVTGAAAITGNGSLAGFSGSTIVVDVVGGNATGFSNIQLTFHDGAVAHFGADPLGGVVSHVR